MEKVWAKSVRDPLKLSLNVLDSLLLNLERLRRRGGGAPSVSLDGGKDSNSSTDSKDIAESVVRPGEDQVTTLILSSYGGSHWRNLSGNHLSPLYMMHCTDERSLWKIALDCYILDFEIWVFSDWLNVTCFMCSATSHRWLFWLSL
jgi:hypothetical protein